MKILRSTWFPIAALLLLLTLAFRAGTAADAARNGLALSFQIAVPALFPFIAASALLTKSGLASALGRLLSRLMWALYGLDGNCAAALVLGLTGGYPVGAQCACELYQAKLITKSDAEHLLGFCNNTGPAFILGVAGVAVCGSARTGAALYLIHVLSALLCGLALTRAPAPGSRPPMRRIAPDAKPNASTAFVAAVQEAFAICLNVTAFITFFSVLLALLRETDVLRLLAHGLDMLLKPVGLPTGTANALLCGSLELTNGLSTLAQLTLPPRLLLPTISFLLGFGGLSVHCQALCSIQACGLSAVRHTAGKLLHGVVSAALSVIWCCAAPRSVPVFSAQSLPSSTTPIIAGFLLLTLAATILLIKNSGNSHVHKL